MNILHTEYSQGWGGQEIRIFTEAQGMRDRGYHVFFAVQKGAELGKRAKVAGFEVLECDFRRRKCLITIPQLVRFIKKNRIELVNTHSSKDAWIGGIAARIGGAKIIRTRHLTGHIRGGINSLFLYKLLADYVITTSSSIIPIISKKARIPINQLCCIATGINPDKVHSTQEEVKAFREKFSIKDTDFVVGTLCVVRSWKGIADFIQTAEAFKTNAAIKFLVVGGGHLDKFKSLAEEKDLGNLIFTGHMENPFPALMSFDIFCLLSTANEGISQASLQAAYLRKPMITTRTGGLPEVCVDRDTGFLVDNCSPEQIIDKIKAIMSDPTMAKQMGDNGRKLVEGKFTIKHMLDQTEGVYNKL